MGRKFNVLIIGAGRIGAFNDTPISTHVLSHAHALTKHKGFSLVGFVDVNYQKAKVAAKVWGVKAFRDITVAFKTAKIDVAVLCTPDTTHYALLKKLANFPLKMVLAEKPLTDSYHTARLTTKIYREKKIPLAVNLTRRFVPEFEKIREEITKGTYGRFITGNGYYGKGLMHNGIHLIDLLRWLIGEVGSAYPYAKIRDYGAKDPSVSAILVFKNGGSFLLQAIDSRLYTIFEIDLLFEKARITFDDALFEAKVALLSPNQVFNGFRNLKWKRKIKLSQPKALFYVAENIYQYLSKSKDLKCTSREVLKSMQVCERLRANSK